MVNKQRALPTKLNASAHSPHQPRPESFARPRLRQRAVAGVCTDACRVRAREPARRLEWKAVAHFRPRLTHCSILLALPHAHARTRAANRALRTPIQMAPSPTGFRHMWAQGLRALLALRVSGPAHVSRQGGPKVLGASHAPPPCCGAFARQACPRSACPRARLRAAPGGGALGSRKDTARPTGILLIIYACAGVRVHLDELLTKPRMGGQGQRTDSGCPRPLNTGARARNIRTPPLAPPGQARRQTIPAWRPPFLLASSVSAVQYVCRGPFA